MVLVLERIGFLASISLLIATRIVILTNIRIFYRIVIRVIYDAAGLSHVMLLRRNLYVFPFTSTPCTHNFLHSAANCRI